MTDDTDTSLRTRIVLGSHYEITVPLGDGKVWIARLGPNEGEGMQIESEKVTAALVAAIDELWRREF